MQDCPNIELRIYKIGKGVMASRPIAAGVVVFKVFPFVMHEQWINYTNHSCVPNCALRGREIVTLTDIQPGEQITIDYDQWTLGGDGWNFDCTCATGACRGRIIGPAKNK
jgi:hypothetical protein